MLIVIDNYDSFTYNLVQYLQTMDMEVRVFRNDEVTVGELEELAPGRIVISPGPCTPRQAGISVELVRTLSGRLPILGVCLGHQSIAAVHGAKVVRAENILHGKTSKVLHAAHGLFDGIANPFEATRYHSLIVPRDELPSSLQVVAWTQDDEIMALCSRRSATWGVQFHPESILTESGHDLLRNFLRLCAG